MKLKILTSNGSLENLQRLSDPSSHVDVGVVQAGISTTTSDQLVSLGSISYQPVLIFYRSSKPLELLSDFSGKKLSIGPLGSGTRNFALAMLAQNGIKEGGSTALLDLEAEDASKALLDRKIDAAFVMSESASSKILGELLRSKKFDFSASSKRTPIVAKSITSMSWICRKARSTSGLISLLVMSRLSGRWWSSSR